MNGKEKNALADMIIMLALIAVILVLVLSDEDPARPETTMTPDVMFTPDSIRIDVEGQVFNWGTLSIMGKDTMHLGVFVHESVLPQAE